MSNKEISEPNQNTYEAKSKCSIICALGLNFSLSTNHSSAFSFTTIIALAKSNNGPWYNTFSFGFRRLLKSVTGSVKYVLYLSTNAWYPYALNFIIIKKLSF